MVGLDDAVQQDDHIQKAVTWTDTIRRKKLPKKEVHKRVWRKHSYGSERTPES